MRRRLPLFSESKKRRVNEILGQGPSCDDVTLLGLSAQVAIVGHDPREEEEEEKEEEEACDTETQSGSKNMYLAGSESRSRQEL